MQITNDQIKSNDNNQVNQPTITPSKASKEKKQIEQEIHPQVITKPSFPT